MSDWADSDELTAQPTVRSVFCFGTVMQACLQNLKGEAVVVNMLMNIYL